mgnify:CR=1 FL=1
MKRLSKSEFDKHLVELQIELVKLQHWVKQNNKRVVILFEGRDTAGKGGVIKRIVDKLNPRICRIAALGVPTEKERSQWYFQRYVSHLPSGGEIVLFDRSWYNRAGVEKVMGFCTEQEHSEFLRACPEFERMLINDGIILFKYWFSISFEVQQARFEQRLSNPVKRWKFSEMDLESRHKWNEYSVAKDLMLQHTDTEFSPWYLVDADDKRRARLNCIRHFLSQLAYGELCYPEIKLDKVRPPTLSRPDHDGYHHVEKFY